MPYAFLAVVALIAAIAAAALAWPLRKASPRAFTATVLGVPVLAIGLYLLIGTPAALDREAMRAATNPTPATMQEAIAELRAELERNPARLDGWVLLARSYTALGDHANARDSYARALKLLPDDAGLLVDAAQARANADPRNLFDDEALAMLRQALVLEPGNQRAPWFIGIAHRQRGEDAQAATVWEALLPTLDATTTAALRAQIDEARAAAGMPPLPAGRPKDDTPAAAQPGLRVRVSLDPDFAARVRLRDDANVFVIARIPGGPPMPVAVEKHPVQALPLEVVLDDGDSPMPTQTLSALREVEVFARLSASGSATRQDGDLDSTPVRTALPADGPLELVIGTPSP